MKKNIMMRLASGLLVAVLLSTCAISGTFAKYVTSKNGTSGARVAKWGVAIETSSDSGFKTVYDTDEKDGYTGISVQSSTEDNVVAPGTRGTLAAFAVTGTPEVAVRVKYTVNNLKLTGWNIGGADYCPLVFVIGDTKYYVGMNETVIDTTSLESAVKEAVESFSAEYGPNVDLSKQNINNSVSWYWAFDEEAADYVSENGQNDDKDTALGNWETSGGNAPTVTIEVTATVTQID